MRNLALPGVRSALGRLGFVLAGQLVGLALVYGLTVHTVIGRQFADASLRGAIAARPLLSGTVESILDVVSIASLLGAMAVVASIALLRLARLQGLLALGILLAANATTWLLKNVLLTRPDLGLDEVAPATLNSLPSGHVTAVFSAVAALAFVMPRPWRDATATVGAACGALTGLATMLAGWHRGADSVAAFLLVGALTTVAAAVVVLAASTHAAGPSGGWYRGPAARRPAIRWLARFAGVSIVLGAVLALGVILASLAPGNVLGSAVAFVVSGLFVSGAAALVALVLLHVLDVMEATLDAS